MHSSIPTANGKALFLDRDGIVNVDKAYVFRIEDFEFIPGIFELCRTAQVHGFQIVIATNQSGIGRGFYTESDYHALTAWMLAEFAREGVQIAKTYYSPHHPDGIGEYRRASEDRKPRPGMLLRAAHELNLDLPRCILAGDKESDVQAGIAAGVGLNLLLWSSDDPPPAASGFTLVRSLAEIEMILKSDSVEP
jgi:D-glycero-D-manno-heptose 1,7-bisphosphate phosphatase